jgi:DNA-binding CsgD family transcriptional regulator
VYSDHDVSALNLGQERVTGASLAQLALALFDEIECGLIVCDGQGAMHFANQSARRELASQLLLQHGGGVLRRAPGGSGEFDTALRQAAQRGLRSLVRLAQGSDQLMVTVLPFRPQGVDTALVLVMLGRRQPCSDLGLEMLAGSYGLTLAERRVLGALVRQATPREIASANKVKLSTVRTQISSIRTKFGTRSIEGLLLRTAQVPPVASALRLAGVSSAAPQAAPMLAAA